MTDALHHYLLRFGHQGNRSGDASCIHYTLEWSQRVCKVIYSWRPTSLQRGGGELPLDRPCSRSVLLPCHFKSRVFTAAFGIAIWARARSLVMGSLNGYIYPGNVLNWIFYLLITYYSMVARTPLNCWVMLGWLFDKKYLTRLGDVTQLVGLISSILWLWVPIIQYLGGSDRRIRSSPLSLAR